MKVDLTPRQSEFFAARERYVACVAGFGSGKTMTACTKLFASVLKYPTVPFAYLAPTYPLIRDIFYPYVSEFLDSINLRHRINRQDNIIHIQGHGSIICRTMERPEMIIGWEVGDAFLDEFDVLPKAKASIVLDKTKGRLRTKFPDGKVNQLFITTTPEGFKETYRRFKKDPLPDSRLIKMSTYDNKHLPENYITDLEAQYPEQLIQAYLHGEFVNLTSGSVYYSFDRNTNCIDWVEGANEAIHIGMDFNVYKMAGIAHIIRNKKVVAIEEFVDLRDTPDMVDSIRERFPNSKIIVYPDAAGKGTSSKSATLSDIKLLREAGFYIKARDSNPRIKTRVASVNNCLENGIYYVNKERCPLLCDSLEQQVYNENTGQPDKDNETEHRNDALGYFLSFLFPISKPSFAVGGN